MFRRPFHAKSNISIRGSDRRKLNDAIREQFPSLDLDQVSELTPSRDEMTVLKIITHSDCIVHVYCLFGNPIFFRIENRLFPTVYTLWKHPDLLPCLVTWPPVLEKVAGGADLMLPGVLVPDDGHLPQLTKGQLCAVSALGNRAPFAVGHAGMSTSDMVASGMKGKGIRIVHCYTDVLWAHGDKSPLPDILSDPSSTNTSTLATNPTCSNHPPSGDLEGLTLEDGSPSLQASAEAPESRAFEEEEEEEDSLSPTERMDQLLHQCALHALKAKLKPSDLPMLTASFYGSYVLPCCPEGRTLDIKKTSYKKFSKFLLKLQSTDDGSEPLLRTRCQKKGVDLIVEVYRNHPDIRSFVVPTSAADEAAVGGATSKSRSAFEVRSLCGVTADMVPILKHSNFSKGDWLTHETLREAVTHYVKLNDLADHADDRMVNLDGPLHDVLIKRSEGYVEQLKWAQLYTRCNGKMTSGYEVILQGKESSGIRNIRKGKLPMIQLKVEKRSGNKKITVIQNLDGYGIEPKDFAHRLQVGVAASSKVSPLPGQGSQVMIQGNQIKFIEKLLTDHYNIPRKYLQGLELASKSGK